MINNNFKTSTETLVLPDISISDSDIENLTLVDPIEFLSEEENNCLLSSLKQRLRKTNKSNNWISLEECEQRLKEILLYE